MNNRSKWPVMLWHLKIITYISKFSFNFNSDSHVFIAESDTGDELAKMSWCKKLSENLVMSELANLGLMAVSFVASWDVGRIGFGVIEAIKVLQFFAAVKIVHIAKFWPKRRSFKIKSESGHWNKQISWSKAWFSFLFTSQLSCTGCSKLAS